MGVHTIRQHDNKIMDFWQIFDAETLSFFPEKFKSITSFNGANGSVFDFEDNCHFVSVIDGTKLIVSKESFLDCSEVVDNIAIVTNKDNTKNYVHLENGVLTTISRRFLSCYLPKENIGCVKIAENKWCYAKVNKNGVEIIESYFSQTKDFQENYGVVQNFDGRWTYVTFVNNELKVLPFNFQACFPIKEGVARIVNDDSTMNYAIIDGDVIKLISKDVKYGFEFNEGICRVVNKEDESGNESVTYFRKLPNNTLVALGAREFNSQNGRFRHKYSFLDAEDFADGINQIVYDDDTVSFGVLAKNEIQVFPTRYKNAGKIVDGVARVEYIGGGEGYVVFKNNDIASKSEKFKKVRDFHNGFGVVRNPFGTERYVKEENGEIKDFTSNFVSCQDYEKGFGMVQTEKGYAILDKNGLPYVLRENLEKAVCESRKYAKFYSEKLAQIKNEDKLKEALIEDIYFSR